MFGIHFLPLKINSNCHILKRYFYSSLSFFVLIIMTKCILNLMLHIYKVTYSVALLRLGVSKSINNLGGGESHDAHPPRQRPLKIDTGFKCTFIAQFFKTNSLKKKLDR